MNKNLELWRRNNWLGSDLFPRSRFLETFFNDEFPKISKFGEDFAPKFELSESASNIEAKIDLPGIKKEEIKVDLHDNILTVSGERKEETKDEKKHYTEINYGSFQRSISLPTNVSSEKVSAKFENGVLTVSMAKMDTPNKRSIQIK